MALTFNQVKPTTVSQEQVPAPKNETGMANVTIRVDADCFLLCDGEFMEDIQIVANQIIKAKLPVGQHLLEFMDMENPDIKVEKPVDFPDEGKNYLVLIKCLQEAGSKAKENAAKAEAEKQMRLEAERKAKEEAVRKAKEEAERKAKEEAERKAKQKTMEIKVTNIESEYDGIVKDHTTIWVDIEAENTGTREFYVKLKIIDILTDKLIYTESDKINHLDLEDGGCSFFLNNNSIPSKFKCQAIIRWKGNVIATSEFYELDRKEGK